MEEEEESEDSQDILTKLTLNEDDIKSKVKLAEHLSRYKVITKEMVLRAIVKEPKARTDVDNRIIADYLTKNYDYFQKIKETSHKKFLKLISVINFETYLPNELIMNINYDEDKFFIVFEGLVYVYRQSFYEKEMKIGDFCNYIFSIKKKDEEQYSRIINLNKHFGIDFEEFADNPYFNRFKMKKFIFNIEELEEIGKFGNGYVFGEMNLIRKKKKNIIVKTINRTQVISVSKFDFNRILRTIEEKRLELLSERFRKKFTMFKFWSMEQLINLFNYCSYKVFHKDDYIYKQNEPSQYIYFIEKGKFEQYCNTSYSWYKNYIEYIGNMKDNLINLIMDKSPENTRKLREIYEEEVKNQEKKDNLIKNDKIPNLYFLNLKDVHLEKKESMENKYIKRDNLYSIKKEEDELNDPNKIIKIPILTSEMPRIIGLEEPFEFKRRFTTVKCLSGKIIAKKINVYDLLRLLYLFKEFGYDENSLNLLVQKKIILIETIKMHLKRNAVKFEKEIDSKYNELIKQNEDYNKKVAATKFKGWNNGFYLDNILDTSLHLFKPKPKKIVMKEKEYRYNVVHNILRSLPEKNAKKSNITYLNISKHKKKEPFLLTERRTFSPKVSSNNEYIKDKIENVKNVINSYNEKNIENNFIQKKLEEDDSDLYNIEKKIRKPFSLDNKRTIVNNINLGIKKITMSKFMSPINTSKIFKNFKKNNLYSGLKVSKLSNKKIKEKIKTINISNSNSNINKSNRIYPHTLYNNSIVKFHKNKKIYKDNNTFNLTNKFDSFSNNKNSFLSGSKDKEGKYLPSIINSDKINIKEGMKKLFLIKKNLLK